MKRVVAEIVDQEPRIDVLINNAGALFAKRRLTEDGLERTFVLNHMAYRQEIESIGKDVDLCMPGVGVSDLTR
jgi:NAD(P)-dependent dehydrogenase (short-subunit alcohol dehydrogenase family)